VVQPTRHEGASRLPASVRRPQTSRMPDGRTSNPGQVGLSHRFERGLLVAAQRALEVSVTVQRYESWVERQVREAIERGEFNHLPGAGKPIPGLNGREDENWWIKEKLEHEDIRGVLPTSLALRKEVEELPATLDAEHHEHAVREIVGDLNRRIRESRLRREEGPMIIVQTVDVEATVAAWRARRS
jgi:DnaJ-like protein